MIKEMSIDLETYSDVDISKCGAYKYAESDNFEILLFGVSILVELLATSSLVSEKIDSVVNP